MNKHLVNSIKENVLAVLISFFLAFIVVFVISKVDFLKADITWYKQSKLLKNVDFIVAKNNSGFKIISNKNFEGIQSVVVDLVYDTSKVKISDDKIEPDNVSLSFLDTGSLELLLNGPISFKKDDVVFKIVWVNGNYINLDSIQIIFTDWKVADVFNIWTLNK